MRGAKAAVPSQHQVGALDLLAKPLTLSRRCRGMTGDRPLCDTFAGKANVLTGRGGEKRGGDVYCRVRGVATVVSVQPRRTPKVETNYAND